MAQVIDQFSFSLTDRLVILTTLNYIMQKHHNYQKVKDMIGLNGRVHFKHRGRKKFLGLRQVVG
jgi:hypothetical protein